MSVKPSTAIALSAQLVELSGQAPAEFRVMPAGRFKAKDGRPAGLKQGWNLTDALAQKLIDAANRQNDRFLIDYDHQTLHAKDHGGKAPAAGWFSQMEWRPGDGLYALGVEWTAAAQAAIDAKEYRYISPVLTYDASTGDVTGLLMAAIVNYPALDGLTDLAAAHFLIHQTTECSMDDDLLERLRYLLNLPTASTAQDIAAELDKVKTLILGPDGQPQGLAALLQRHKADAEALAAKLSEPPDPAKFAPVDALQAMQTELAALKAKVDADEIKALIEPALADGRLIEAQKEWANELGKSNRAALQSFLDTAQPIAALSGMQSGGKPPADPKPLANALDLNAIYEARKSA